MSFVDDWDEHSIIYSAGIEDGMRGDEQQHAHVLPAASLHTQVNTHRASACSFRRSIHVPQDVFSVTDLGWRGREHGSIKLVVTRAEFMYVHPRT